MSKFVIAVLVDNKPGVLTRVTSMFTRRGFNIDALSVAEIEDPLFSRITITITGDEQMRDQFIGQLRKFHNVKKVQLLEASDSIKRELLLIKIRYTSESRSDIMAAAEIYRAKIIDYTTDAMSVELTGDPLKIDAFIELMLPLGILEMCRTGIVAIERGAKTMLNAE